MIGAASPHSCKMNVNIGVFYSRITISCIHKLIIKIRNSGVSTLDVRNVTKTTLHRTAVLSGKRHDPFFSQRLYWSICNTVNFVESKKLCPNVLVFTIITNGQRFKLAFGSKFINSQFYR